MIGGFAVVEINLSDVLQIVQALSIAFGIIAFFFEYRRNVRDRGYNTYIQTIMSLVDMEKLFIQYPEMQNLYEYDEEYKSLRKEKRRIYHYCSMLLDVFEIAFIASPYNRGWMDKEEWGGWEQYIKELAKKSEEFRLAWKLNKDFYCKKFQNFMERIMS
jgi:hypothetical protein